MYRASLLLKNCRLEKQLEIHDICQKLKVPPKHLLAIESEDVANFPQEPYCSLIVKDYANFLGLNGQEILSFFRRDFAQKHQPKNSSLSRFGFTPQLTFSLAIIFSIIIFSVYLIFEFIKFNQPPRLVVNWPKEVISSSTLDLSGTTDSESTIKINDSLILINPDGSFTKKINLNKGDNQIIVQSQSPNGKTTTSQFSLKALY